MKSRTKQRRTRKPQPKSKPRRSGARRRRLARVLAATAAAGTIAGAGLAIAETHTAPRASAWITGLSAAAELPDLDAWLRRESFQMERVLFRGLEVLEGENLAELAGLRPGQPLIDVDPDLVRTRIEAHPRVASAQVLRLPPDRLIIRVQERLPVAALAGHEEGLDSAGRRFPLTPGEAQTLVVLEGDADPEELVAHAVPILAAADRTKIELSSVRIAAPDDIVLETRGAALRIRVGEEGPQALGRFAELRASEVLARVPAREADLRFSGQVVLRNIERH